jgi:hypothetical protein
MDVSPRRLRVAAGSGTKEGHGRRALAAGKAAGVSA